MEIRDPSMTKEASVRTRTRTRHCPITDRRCQLTIDSGWREVADTALAFVASTVRRSRRPESSGVGIPITRLGIDLLHHVHPDAGRVPESKSPLTPRFVS